MVANQANHQHQVRERPFYPLLGVGERSELWTQCVGQVAFQPDAKNSFMLMV